MKIFVPVMLFIFLVFAILFLNPHVWAAETKTPTQTLMGQFLSHMDALKPYLVSEEKFKDSKNDADIRFHLKELANLSKKAGHDPRFQSTGYRISRKVLEDHITETERVFRIGNNKPYARWMLNSTLSICMSCHTQMPTASRNLKEFEKLETFSSPFDQAEFLFSTRAFDKANDIFDAIIMNYPSKGTESDKLEKSLEKVITYYARIKRDPEGALKVLNQYQKNEKLPEYLKADIKAWIESFKDWKKESMIDYASATDDQVIEFAKKNLDPKVTSYVLTADNPRAVTYLKVSGVLYDWLQKHPKSEATPEVLYWLSICDRGLSNNFFYSLGDIYLRECITSFPKSAAAKKCYDEYEQQVLISYSGSSGTHLPADASQDLKRLKALINKNK